MSILQHSNLSKLIRLETEASLQAIGGFLYQQDTDIN